MIDRVVIYDLKCGGRFVDSNDIRQMIARCGRTYRKFEQGNAYVLHLPDEADFAQECVSSPPEPLVSSLSDYENLVFHLIPLIEKGSITGASGIDDWFSRSFSYAQGNRIDSSALVSRMSADGVLLSGFRLSDMASLSSRFYYPFHAVQYLDSKLKRHSFSFDSDRLAYLLSHDDIGPVHTDHYRFFEEDACFPKGGFLRNEKTQMYMFRCLLDNYRPSSIRRHIDSFVSDCGRFFSMYGRLLESNGFDSSAAELLRLRVSTNCTKEEAELMMRLGFEDRRTARLLVEHGAVSKERYSRCRNAILESSDEGQIHRIDEIFGVCEEK